jgi:DNA-binding response OmpR family regulator
MKVLIAEDEAISCRLLEATLRKGGYEVLSAHDGEQAWQILQEPAPPPVVILDWLMPKLDSVEVCRRVRQDPKLKTLHVILLTSRGSRQDLVQGFEAGADDYIIKPFDPQELGARVHVGARIAELQRALAERVRELEDALGREKQLQGLLPICCYCKKIRDDKNYWHQVEAYVAHHADVRFSHGICPECSQKLLKELGNQPA